MSRYESKELLAQARGRSCVICQQNDGTTVPAHLPGSFYRMAAGTGQKTHDWLVAHLCEECHRNMDTIWRKDAQMRMIALVCTLERLFDEGVLSVTLSRSGGGANETNSPLSDGSVPGHDRDRDGGAGSIFNPEQLS